MSTANGNVQQISLTGPTIDYEYTDTGSYGAVSSRILTVYDYLGGLFATYIMGNNLTQVVSLTVDGWFDFRCVVTDNTGTYTKDVYYVAGGLYIDASLALFASGNCGCSGNNKNLIEADYCYQAALRYNLAGPSAAVQANQAILDAGILVASIAVQ